MYTHIRTFSCLNFQNTDASGRQYSILLVFYFNTHSSAFIGIVRSMKRSRSLFLVRAMYCLACNCSSILLSTSAKYLRIGSSRAPILLIKDFNPLMVLPSGRAKPNLIHVLQIGFYWFSLEAFHGQIWDLRQLGPESFVQDETSPDFLD